MKDVGSQQLYGASQSSSVGQIQSEYGKEVGILLSRRWDADFICLVQSNMRSGNDVKLDPLHFRRNASSCACSIHNLSS